MTANRLNQTDAGHAVSADRDELVRQHMGLVHQTVERLGGSMARSNGSFDDLLSAGMVGLLSAFDGFDPARGSAFSTYAYPRVRGAVLDELRRQDIVPRSVRRKKRAVLRAKDRVNARTNGASTPQAVADEMGVDLKTLFQWELDAAVGNTESLDTGVSAEVLAAHTSDALESPAASPDAALEQEEDVDAVREALSRLPEQERLVLILYFYENLKLRQIGELVGVSESRVSQIRTRAIARLREEMGQAAA